jgi:hypothetical protein
MRQYNKRYLLIGLFIAIILFFGSLWLFPEWKQDWRLIISLVLGVIVAAVGFLANFRQAFEQEQESSNNSLENRTMVGEITPQENRNITGNNNTQVGPITNSTGVAIGENARVNVTQKRTINTGGGNYIEGDVNTQGGDFVGRDKKQ